MKRGDSEQVSVTGRDDLMSVSRATQNNGVGTIQYIVLVQLIGCALVVFGHSYPYEGVPAGADLVRRFVYSFHMPLFVWCSGFLAVIVGSATKYSFTDFVRRRAKRLLIPYFAISLIGILPKVVFARVLNDPLQLGFREIVVAFLVPRLNIWGHFWFLPMIFLIGLLGYGADRMAHLSGRPRLVLGLMTLASAVLIFFVVSYPASKTVIAVLMILTVVTFGIWLSARIQISRDAVYTQTYQIFILSWPFQLIAEIFAEKILGLGFGVVMPLMFAAGLLLPMLTIHFVNRFESRTGTRLLSLMLGR